jgi:hypothetical protein
MKYCAGVATVFGLAEIAFVDKISQALAASRTKPPLLWLAGQDCAGCTVSLAGSLNPPISSIILDTLSIRYHETIMASAGYLAEATYEDTVKAGGYVLCVEGSIPMADDRFCMIGGRPFREMVEEAACGWCVFHLWRDPGGHAIKRGGCRQDHQEQTHHQPSDLSGSRRSSRGDTSAGHGQLRSPHHVFWLTHSRQLQTPILFRQRNVLE